MITSWIAHANNSRAYLREAAAACASTHRARRRLRETAGLHDLRRQSLAANSREHQVRAKITTHICLGLDATMNAPPAESLELHQLLQKNSGSIWCVACR